MDLIRKLRTLLGTWAHKPFAPAHDKPAPQPGSSPTKEAGVTPGRTDLQDGEEVPEEERVADLIAQQRLAPDSRQEQDKPS